MYLLYDFWKHPGPNNARILLLAGALGREADPCCAHWEHRPDSPYAQGRAGQGEELASQPRNLGGSGTVFMSCSAWPLVPCPTHSRALEQELSLHL